MLHRKPNARNQNRGHCNLQCDLPPMPSRREIFQPCSQRDRSRRRRVVTAPLRQQPLQQMVVTEGPCPTVVFCRVYFCQVNVAAMGFEDLDRAPDTVDGRCGVAPGMECPHGNCGEPRDLRAVAAIGTHGGDCGKEFRVSDRELPAAGTSARDAGQINPFSIDGVVSYCFLENGSGNVDHIVLGVR